MIACQFSVALRFPTHLLHTVHREHARSNSRVALVGLDVAELSGLLGRAFIQVQKLHVLYVRVQIERVGASPEGLGCTELLPRGLAE